MTSHPATNVWQVSYRIRSSEVDRTGIAKPEALLNLFQEAATDHAEALGVGAGLIEGHNLAWVLSRLQVHFPVPVGWKSTVCVETWPSGVDRLYAFRDFVLTDSDDRLPAAGVSTWLLIDVARRRPVRMPTEVSDIPIPKRPRAHLPDDLPSEPLDAYLKEGNRSARSADIDINGHVNNVRYVEWLTDEIPASIRENYRLSNLDLRFKSESVEGDSLAVMTKYPSSPSEPCVVTSTIRHAGTKRVAVLANMVWRSR